MYFIQFLLNQLKHSGELLECVWGCIIFSLWFDVTLTYNLDMTISMYVALSLSSGVYSLKN